MKIYIIQDSDDNIIQAVYDEENFLKHFKEHTRISWGCLEWGRYTKVTCWNEIGESLEDPEPDDIRKILNS